MERIRTNPAFRLHGILKKSQPNQPAKAVLASVFGVGADDTAALFRAFGKLIALVDQVERCIELIGDDMREEYRFCLIPIRAGLAATQLNAAWFQSSHYSPSDLAHLRITAEELNKVVPEDQIQNVEFDEIRTQLAELRQDIGLADIDPKFKAALLAVIARLLDTMADYRWVGADGIKRATAEAFGQFVVEKEGFFSCKEAPWVARYWTVVSRLADLAALATAGHLIGIEGGEAVERFLLGPK